MTLNSFETRYLIHFSIKGKEERILPTLICIQDDDIEYMNNLKEEIDAEIKALIIENITDIEKKAHSELKAGYTLLPIRALICAAFSVSIRNESSNYCILEYHDNNCVSAPSIAKFSLTLWICPIGKINLIRSLVCE